MTKIAVRTEDEEFVCYIKAPEGDPKARRYKVAHAPSLGFASGLGGSSRMVYPSTTFEFRTRYTHNCVIVSAMGLCRDPHDVLRSAVGNVTQGDKGAFDRLRPAFNAALDAAGDRSSVANSLRIRIVHKEVYVVAEGPIPVDLIVPGPPPGALSELGEITVTAEWEM